MTASIIEYTKNMATYSKRNITNNKFKVWYFWKHYFVVEYVNNKPQIDDEYIMNGPYGATVACKVVKVEEENNRLIAYL